ncbi:putative RNA methylase family UPF0020-domain-containing protein [Chlamydoabsidia padenii]|nr:putative RNA methylase family UPF0020-domain-containing protein [Chlamydoabsidia padenii]
MEGSTIHILFHVPEGLEQTAIVDLKETIFPFELADPLATVFIGEERTGRAHLFSKLEQQDDIKRWIQYLQSTVLLSVYHMTIITKTTTVPLTVYHDEQDQEVLGKYLYNTIQEAPWQQYIPSLNNNTDNTPCFRATFYKDQLQHGIKTQELGGWMGYAYNQLYPDWKVSLKTYDYDVVGVWGRTRDVALLGHFGLADLGNAPSTNDEDHRPIILHVGFNIPMPDTKYRNRLYLGRTSLNPPIAYCLVRLANPLPGQIIMDMCCGTGTIPIEGAGKYPNTFWVGGEVKVKTLCLKAKGNMQHAGVQNVDLLISDGRKLNIRSGCIDTVISDWPWGVREGSFATIQKLYPKFMRQLGRVLRNGGKGYIVCQGNKLMQRVLDYDWVKDLFRIDEIINIAIGGLGVCVYILIKK